LRAPLTVRAYVSERLPESVNPYLRKMLDLLEDVRAAGGELVRLEVIDPDAAHLSALERKRLHEQAEREGVTRVVLTIQEADRQETLQVYAGISCHYEGRAPAVIPFAVQRPNLEYDLAVAFQRLVLPRERVVLAGAGTGNYGRARGALAQAYAVQELDLALVRQIPAEAAAVVYAAPVPPSRERDVYLLDQYVARGGNLILLTEGHLAAQRELTARELPAEGPLQRALQAWGLELEGLVFTSRARSWTLAAEGQRVMGAYGWYVDARPEENAASPVAGGLGLTLFPYASSVRAHAPEGVQVVPLVTTPEAWVFSGDVDLSPLRQPRSEEPGQARHLALALQGHLPSAWSGGRAPAPPDSARQPDPDPLAEPLTAPSAPGRVVLVGDADFLRDGNQVEGAPGVALLLNMVDWSLDRSLAQVRSRQSVFPLNDLRFVAGMPRASALTLLHTLLLPLAVVGGGLAWTRWRRRRWAREAARARDARAQEVGAA
jgi:ABC-type uncharacterized transport system involved in gliding motility auxiliary subunit